MGRIWINFKVPFDHAELQKKVVNPYFPFNPNKEDTNGKQIFKSPLLKQSKLSIWIDTIFAGENKDKVISDMRRLMDMNREHMLLPHRNIVSNHNSIHSNFAQLVQN